MKSDPGESKVDLESSWELPKTVDGGGPSGVKEFAFEGGAPAGVDETLLKRLPDFSGVEGGLES